MLAFVFCLGIFAGCGKKDNGDDNPPDKEVYVPTEDEQTKALVFGIDGADGVFSPFFSSAAYDSEIVGQTQLGMLTTDNGKLKSGDNYACVAKDHRSVYLDSQGNEIKNASDAKFTRYDFIIKKGLKFSDGVDLTIKDVLFNLYVYLDPVYTGSATIYSTDIVGLNEYRTQSKDESANDALEEQAAVNAQTRLKRASDWLNNQALLEDTPNGKYEELTAEQKKQYVMGLEKYETEINKDIEFFIPYYRQEVEGNYQSAISSFEDDRKNTYAYDEGEYWQSFLYMYGIIDIAYNAKGEPIKTTVGTGDDKVELYTFNFADDPTMTNGCKWVKDYIEEYDAENWENMSGATTLEKHNNAKMEAAIELVYSTTVGANDENGKFKYEYSQFALTILSSGSTNTLLTEMQADEKSKIIDNTAGDNLVRSISGITTSKVDTFAGEKLDGEYDMLSIKIKNVDPKAIWNFAFTVAPLHYYSYAGAGDEGEWNVKNNFGVRYNDTDFMNNVLKDSEKLGVPVGAGPYKASKERGLGENELYPSKNEFKKNNRVYYERNTYFDLVDGKKGRRNSECKGQIFAISDRQLEFSARFAFRERNRRGERQCDGRKCQTYQRHRLFKGRHHAHQRLRLRGHQRRQNRRRLDAPRDHEGDGHLDYQQRIL